MNEPSPKAGKFLTVIGLTLFILAAFVLSGFTVTHFNPQTQQVLPPADGGTSGQAATRVSAQQAATPTNIIRNGGFELPWVDNNGVAPEWQGYRNGQAWAAWYLETWPEAVRSGKQAQLMEIFQVEPNILDRFIAIYQTLNVEPNSRYDLTFYAIMRSSTGAHDRNKFEGEMDWGVDYSGQGEFENVQEWVYIPLTEQFRLGSTGKYPEDIPLRYEVVTGTIMTGNSSQITLFIRGWKKFPTGAEYNFDVDDVSLVGPIAQPVSPTPVPTAPPSTGLPTSGAIVSSRASAGAFILASLVLIVLGATAAASVLRRRKG